MDSVLNDLSLNRRTEGFTAWESSFCGASPSLINSGPEGRLRRARRNSNSVLTYNQECVERVSRELAEPVLMDYNPCSDGVSFSQKGRGETPRRSSRLVRCSGHPKLGGNVDQLRYPKMLS